MHDPHASRDAARADLSAEELDSHFLVDLRLEVRIEIEPGALQIV